MVALCLTPDLEIRVVINLGATRLVKHRLRKDKEHLADLCQCIEILNLLICVPLLEIFKQSFGGTKLVNGFEKSKNSKKLKIFV